MSIHQINLKLTADMMEGMGQIKELQKELSELQRFQKSIELQTGGRSPAVDARIKAIKKRISLLSQEKLKVEAVNKAIAAGENAHNKNLKGSGKFSQAMGQVSFALEDFMAVYGTMGLQGALRASTNNFSMVARILSGPLAGGIVGVGLMLIPMLINAFKEGDKAAKAFGETLNDALKDIEDRQELRDFKLKIDVEIASLNSIKSMKDLPSFKEMQKSTQATIDKIAEIREEMAKLSNEKFTTSAETSQFLIGGTKVGDEIKRLSKVRELQKEMSAQVVTVGLRLSSGNIKGAEEKMDALMKRLKDQRVILQIEGEIPEQMKEINKLIQEFSKNGDMSKKAIKDLEDASMKSFQGMTRDLSKLEGADFQYVSAVNQLSQDFIDLQKNFETGLSIGGDPKKELEEMRLGIERQMNSLKKFSTGTNFDLTVSFDDAFIESKFYELHKIWTRLNKAGDSEKSLQEIKDKTLANLKKQSAELEKHAKLQEQLAIKEKALQLSSRESLAEAGRTEIENLLHKVRQEQEALQEMFDKSPQTKEDERLLKEANESLLKKTIENLTGETHKNTKELIKTTEKLGSFGEGDTLLSSAEEGIIEALKQREEAMTKALSPDNKNDSETVAAIKDLNRALMNNTLIATLSD